MMLAPDTVCSSSHLLLSDALKILVDAFSAFLGGGALTFLLFWSGERLFPRPEMNGRWFVETTTDESAYKPFDGMRLKHEVFIWQEGSVIRGTSEQIFESSIQGNRQNEGAFRVRGEISGYANRSITLPNRVRIHLVTFGEKRTSTAYYSLISAKGAFFRRLRGRDPRKTDAQGRIQQLLTGNFESSAGSQTGTAIWSRNRYDPLFDEVIQKEDSDKYGVVPQISAEGGLEEPS
jgi:hypothetical protein